MHKQLSYALLLSLTMLLTACGGGGGGGGGGVGSGTSTTVSGQVVFQRVTPQNGGGLNYAGTATVPVRGALVEVRHTATDTVWASGYTTDTGTFSLTGPAGEAARIVVKAEMAVNGGTVSVRTGGPSETEGLIWSIYSDVNIPNSGLAGVTMTATSGWNNTGYTASQRSSGPFAILDTLYRARELIRNSSSDDAPALKVFWDPSYSAATITSSKFEPGNNIIRILGAENSDTDEFDHNVVAHEWIHAYQANLSRDDSLGGAHGFDDYLDETIAFSEGLASAGSGMVMGNTEYTDTLGNLQGNGFTVDLTDETPNLVAVNRPGPWKEFTLVPFLFNLYHSGGDNLGFAPFHATLTGDFKDDYAFTTIYSFLHFLKAGYPANAVAIADRADNPEIGINNGHDRFEGSDYENWNKTGTFTDTTAITRYTTVPPDGSIVSFDSVDRLQSYDSRPNFGTLANQTTDSSNKLYNRQFFKTQITTVGTYTFRVTPTDNTGTTDATKNVRLWIANVGGLTNTTDVGAKSITVTANAPVTVAFAVGSANSNQNFVVQVGNPASLQTVPTKPLPPSTNG